MVIVEGKQLGSQGKPVKAVDESTKGTRHEEGPPHHAGIAGGELEERKYTGQLLALHVHPHLTSLRKCPQTSHLCFTKALLALCDPSPPLIVCLGSLLQNSNTATHFLHT